MLGFQDNGLLVKDPDSNLDYAVDFSRWLTGDDTLWTTTITVSGLELVSDEINALPLSLTNGQSTWEVPIGTAIVLWLSGGTPGMNGKVHIRIVTQLGRVRDVSFGVLMRNT